MTRCLLVIQVALIGCMSPPPAAPSPSFSEPPPGDSEPTPPDQPPTPPRDAAPPPDAAIDPVVREQQRREAQWADLEAEAAAHPTRLIGMATITHAVHCGGAAPPPDQPSSVTSPYGGPLFLRRGNQNSARKPAAVLSSLPSGTFDIPLEPGIYCIVGADKKDGPAAAGGAHTDLACLQQHGKTCDAVVEHPSRKAVRIQFYQSCFGPCYTGPYPP